MSEKMNLSVNGQSKVPPGFRFHPTEEELLHYYLRKKVACEKIDLDVIRDVDLNKLEPWEIQETCKIGSTPQNDWYFFSHKDKKYPTGTRTNRATAAGFWKATGRDKAINGGGLRRIGMRKTLVFYRGRAPHGQKSDWIMHEYRLDDNMMMITTNHDSGNDSSITGGDSSSGAEEGWVVCRVFKKKNYHKALESPPKNDAVLDQILTYMGSSDRSSSSPCKQEQFHNNQSPPPLFMHLPPLTMDNNSPLINEDEYFIKPAPLISETELSPPSDWTAMDRLVASQLNGGDELAMMNHGHDDFFSFDHHMHHSSDHRPNNQHHHQDLCSDQTDLWNFSRSSSSSSDPLCHLSV